MTVTITHQRGTLTVVFGPAPASTGPLNADGSFSVTNSVGTTSKGVFATEGGRTVIRDGVTEFWGHCHGTFTAVKQ